MTCAKTFLALLLAVPAFACLATGTPPAGAPEAPSAALPGGGVNMEGAGASPKSEGADEVAEQEGPGGSMPSGAVAPSQPCPADKQYKAEGYYCRFEGEETKSMVWGKITLNSAECTDCDQKPLQIFHHITGKQVLYETPLDEQAEFRFVRDMDDPGEFGLVIVVQPSLFVPGQEPKPAKGFLVEKDFQPYRVDGSLAPCPKQVMDLRKIKMMYKKLP